MTRSSTSRRIIRNGKGKRRAELLHEARASFANAFNTILNGARERSVPLLSGVSCRDDREGAVVSREGVLSKSRSYVTKSRNTRVEMIGSNRINIVALL